MLRESYVAAQRDKLAKEYEFTLGRNNLNRQTRERVANKFSKVAW